MRLEIQQNFLYRIQIEMRIFNHDLKLFNNNVIVRNIIIVDRIVIFIASFYVTYFYSIGEEYFSILRSMINLFIIVANEEMIAVKVRNSFVYLACLFTIRL
jgi:hypothetical protein